MLRYYDEFFEVKGYIKFSEVGLCIGIISELVVCIVNCFVKYDILDLY